ncbi:MAG: glutamate 5-kinase, partial [Agathobacter sp.]|nr:glutamate 5-kinase [Agathobacter sp.]
PDAELIRDVYEISEDILHMAKGTTGSGVGTGGMATKLAAAQIATYSGADMVIANGENVSIVEEFLDGVEVGTCFHANEHKEFKLSNYIMESMN